MKTIGKQRLRLLLLSVLAVSVTLFVAGCGSDDSSTSGASKKASAGNAIDLAFVNDMIPHHVSAVAMAKVAQERSKRAEIKGLADDIIASQSAELTQMKKIAATLEADGVKAGDLGMPADMMGMSSDAASLKTAEPFDRAFIDMMVPHHQSAVRMARVVLAKGASPEVKKLAEAIIAAQSREIGEMNTWRTKYFGSPSPAGGVPAADEAPAAGKEMPADHGSGGMG